MIPVWSAEGSSSYPLDRYAPGLKTWHKENVNLDAAMKMDLIVGKLEGTADSTFVNGYNPIMQSQISNVGID